MKSHSAGFVAKGEEQVRESGPNLNLMAPFSKLRDFAQVFQDIISQKLTVVQRGGSPCASLDLVGLNLTGGFADALAELTSRGDLVADTIDLRKALLSIDELLHVCRAVESAAEHRSARRLSRQRGRAEDAPCWIDLGDNPGFSADSALNALRRSNLRYCLPLRCSRKRCLYRASIHLSCKFAGESSRLTFSAPIVSPAPAIEQALGACPPISRCVTSLPAPTLEPPALLPAGQSPLAHTVANVFSKRVDAICGRADGRRLAAESLEEFELLLPSRLGLCVTGDECDEKAFDTLVRRGDREGMCRFVHTVVERLGGNVIDRESCRLFAAGFFNPQPVTFQSLLQSLHHRLERNEAGIRLPGDYYGINSYYESP